MVLGKLFEIAILVLLILVAFAAGVILSPFILLGIILFPPLAIVCLAVVALLVIVVVVWALWTVLPKPVP